MFEIMDREDNLLKLVGSNGVRIKNNLQLPHLFSFKDATEMIRNMEELFGHFESQYTGIVERLETELSRCTRSIAVETALRILELKLLHLFRNPYGIKKAVDMLPHPERWLLTDPTYRAWHDAIRNETAHPFFGRLNDGDITFEEFKKWRLGLLLLVTKNEAPGIGNCPYAETFLGQLVHDLLADETRITWLVFYVLSTDFPGQFLLSNRGYTADSEPGDKASLILSFNLSDRIAFTFCSIDPVSVPHPNRPWVNNAMLDAVRAELTAEPEVKIVFNDLDRLAYYNERTIYYAHKHVYCSQEQVVGAQVEPAGQSAGSTIGFYRCGEHPC